MLGILQKLLKSKISRPSIGLTIGGGGLKTFYALGIIKVLMENGFEFCSITGTSAGSAIALGVVNNNISEIVDRCCSFADTLKTNFKVDYLLKGKNPFTHETIYKDMLIANIDMNQFSQSRTALTFNALEFPEELSSPGQKIKRSQIILNLMRAYTKENQSARKYEYTPFLQEVIQEYNLKEKIFHIEKNISLDELTNIILACSCVPPFVPFVDLGDEKYYLDGGFHDNLPVGNHPNEKNIDLIIAIYYKPMSKFRNYRESLSINSKVFYIYPDQYLPISTWDTPKVETLKMTYEMGLASGENLIRLLRLKKDIRKWVV